MIDFLDHLRRQLEYLGRSAAAYDSGLRDEAYRIAVALRVLLHDTPASTSLLSHLNAKNTPLLSTTDPASSTALSYDGMSLIATGARNEVRPALGNATTHRIVPADDWLSEVVYVSDDIKLSRRTIILKAANQDGGAHVDHTLDPGYAHFKSGIWEFRSDDPDEEADIPEPQLVFLRQMAYEILNSPAIDDLLRHGVVSPDNLVLKTGVFKFAPPIVEEEALKAMTPSEVDRLRQHIRAGHFSLLDGFYKSSLGGATNPAGNYNIDKRNGNANSLEEWLAPLLAEGLIERSNLPDLYSGTMKGRAFVARIIEIGG